MPNKQEIACIFLIESKLDRSKSIQNLAEACLRLTPQIAIRDSEAIFLEIGKSLTLFSKDSLKLRISILAKRLGLSVKTAFSNHPCMALAKVCYPQFEKTEDLSTLPIDSIACFLDPFEVSREPENKLHYLLETLKALGIKTIQDFLQLPREGLGSRFGSIAILIYSHAQKQREPAWRGFFPSPTIEESLELDEGETEGCEITLEPLLFVLKTLIDRVMVRLCGLGQRASRVQIELKVSAWSTLSCHKRVWELSLPIAQGSTIGLLPIIRERLSHDLSKEPLLAPAQSLKFKILETIPGHGSQRDFFHSRELEAENWDQLLGRLLNQLGKNFVFQATLTERYRPEASWTRKAPTQESKQKDQSSSWHFKRPSRLLKEPEPIILKPALLVHPSGTQWRILNYEGPERISTDWWEEPPLKGIDRDYYRVTTQSGEKLWIYLDRSTKPPQAFLHGYFD